MSRARCPVCGAVRVVQPPAGGDGSVDVFPRHDRADRTGADRTGADRIRCEQGRQLVGPQHYVTDEESPR